MSVYGMVEDAKKQIYKKINNKIEVSRGLVECKAVVVDHLGLTTDQILRQLNENLDNLCPVKLDTEHEQVALHPSQAHVVYFDRTLYLVSTHPASALQDFLHHPTHYTSLTSPNNPNYTLTNATPTLVSPKELLVT